MAIPYEKLSALNKTTTEPWKRLPESMGGGIVGGFEIFHQLYCLVRKIRDESSP